MTMAKGWKASDEARANMAAAHKGRRHSEATKAKMRAARLANNPMKGQSHTDETRAKMRAAHNPQHAKGADAINWKGGRVIDKNGYVLLYMPEHPHAVGNYVLEHRLIVERRIGRYLLPGEEVHHDNEQRDDNRDENLIGPMSKSQHARLHRLRESERKSAQLTGRSPSSSRS